MNNVIIQLSISISILMGLLISNIACSIDRQVPQEADISVPIFIIGDYWVDSITYEGIESTRSMEVIGEDRIEGKACYIVQISLNPPMLNIDYSIAYMDKATLESVRLKMWSNNTLYPFEIIEDHSFKFPDESPFPMKIRKEFSVVDTVTRMVSIQGKTQTETETNHYIFKYEGIEVVTVPAGTFECYKRVKYGENGMLLETSWFSSPTKRPVKIIMHDTQAIKELLLYSLASSGSTRVPIPIYCPLKQPNGFTISDVVFCSEVRGHDDYDLRLDSIYSRGQVVYIYFDFSGATCIRHNDEYKTHTQIASAVLIDPEGQKIGTTDEIIDVWNTTSEPSGNGSSWIAFNAPLLGQSGEYSIEFSIKDVPSGSTATTRTAFIVEDGPLAIEHLHLCSKIRGLGDYTIQPDGACKSGDTIWLYFEVSGLSVNSNSGQNTIWMKIPYLKIYNSQGTLINVIDDVISDLSSYDKLIENLQSTFFYVSLPIDEKWLPDQYRIELTLEDGWTGENITESIDFTIEDVVDII